MTHLLLPKVSGRTKLCPLIQVKAIFNLVFGISVDIVAIAKFERTEFRLLLRHDNADLRLTEIGHEIGLINDERYSIFLEKKKQIEEAYEILNRVYLGKKSEVESYLMELGFNELKGGILAAELLKRPNVRFDKIKEFIPELAVINLDDTGVEQLEILVKYEGYISKQIREAKNMAKLDKMKIPSDIDYLNTDGLALEAREKLNQIRPLTIGQASRISGVNPADVSALILIVRRMKQNG